jgi:hypothetical protein
LTQQPKSKSDSTALELKKASKKKEEAKLIALRIVLTKAKQTIA